MIEKTKQENVSIQMSKTKVFNDKNENNRKELTIFTVRYQWYEDDEGETILGKNVTREEFEKDLIEARDFAEKLMGMQIKTGSYLGKGYSVECLPEYYNQIIWFLTEKKEYAKCFLDSDIEYFIDDADGGRKININKRLQNINWEKINAKTNQNRKKKY